MSQKKISEELQNALIMIVDDDITTLTLTKLYVNKIGWRCVTFDNSVKAMDEIEQVNPDVLLLDYMMPGINGYNFCKQLKQQARWQNLPVLFITALENTDSLVKAFQAGASGYIIKPLNPRELQVRLQNVIELRLSRERLEEFGRHMQVLVEERTKQLIHADRLATLGTLSAGIAHEINNPTTFISGSIQTLERFWETLDELLGTVEDDEGDFTRQVNFIQSEMPGLLEGMKNGVNRIYKIVNSLKTYSRKDKLVKQQFTLSESIANTLELCRNAIKKSGMKVKINQPQNDITLFGDQQQLEQVLVNLVVNAGDAMTGQQNPELDIDAIVQENRVRIEIKDNGPGLDDEVKKKIWDPFFTTKEPGKGTGLGLAISRSIIENHNGSIIAQNLEPRGLMFVITLPLADHKEEPNA